MSATQDVPAPETPVTLTAYKGFSKDWTCRGFQYAIGQTYTHDGKVVRCAEGGYHSCEMPFDVWNYYPLSTSVFARVEVGGDVDHAGEGEDSKLASATITIHAEVRLPEMIRAAVDWIVARAKGNVGVGNRGHAAATGNSGHAAATGINATAMAGETGWIVLAAWADTDDGWQIATVRSAKVGGPEGVQAGVSYRLTTDGAFVEAAP